MIFAETPRLRLRSFEERDLAGQVALLNNQNITRWMGSIPHPYTEDHGRGWMERMKALEEDGKPEFLLLTDRSTDQVRGAIGFHPAHNVQNEDDSYEVGYWLGQPFWNQGLMREALGTALNWARRQTWIQGLVAVTDFENQISQHLLKNVGFIYEGLRPRLEGQGSAEITFWRLNPDFFKEPL